MKDDRFWYDVKRDFIRAIAASCLWAGVFYIAFEIMEKT